MGLRLPSESLLWLLGGVGGKCRCSTEAEEKKVIASIRHQRAGLGGGLNICTSIHEGAEPKAEDSAGADMESSPTYTGKGRGWGKSECRTEHQEALLLYEKGEKENTLTCACLCIKKLENMEET